MKRMKLSLNYLKIHVFFIELIISAHVNVAGSFYHQKRNFKHLKFKINEVKLSK